MSLWQVVPSSILQIHGEENIWNSAGKNNRYISFKMKRWMLYIHSWSLLPSVLYSCSKKVIFFSQVNICCDTLAPYSMHGWPKVPYLCNITIFHWNHWEFQLVLEEIIVGMRWPSGTCVIFLQKKTRIHDEKHGEIVTLALASIICGSRWFEIRSRDWRTFLHRQWSHADSYLHESTT